MAALPQLLLNAQSPQQLTRTTAENQLLAAEEADFGGFLLQLSNELNNEVQSEHVRQLAGVILKNAISGQDRKIDKTKRQKWLDLPLDIASNIKKATLSALTSKVDEARGAASQVTAKIGRVEVPLKRWEDLIPTLLSLVTSPGTVSPSKKGALTTLGYLCDELQLMVEEAPQEEDLLSAESCNKILTAVVTGMADADLSVKLVATKALYHALVFAYRNIQIESERTCLFQVIGESLKCSDDHIRQAAWECVLQMVSEFYEYLGPYIPDLGALSLEAIRAGKEITALPAVEFWNILCDEEIAIMGGVSERESLNIISQTKELLLPTLFEAMTTQASEFTEMDDWTLSMAAGACVGLCAEVLKDDILDMALDFINANFGGHLWQRREAAVLVYGSIMDGPSSKNLEPLISRSFEPLCQRLNDDSVPVRDSTAWTIGRIVKFHFECVKPLLGMPHQNGLMHLLLLRLRDEPRVVQQVCFAIDEIAVNCLLQSDGITNIGEASNNHGNSENGKTDNQNALGSDSTTTSVLDPWLASAVETLFLTAQRPDGDECKLRRAAYAALGSFLEACRGPERKIVVEKLINNVLMILEQAVSSPSSDSIQNIESQLCGLLEICIRIMGPSVSPYTDRCLIVFYKIIYRSSKEVDDFLIATSIAAEDAVVGIAAIATALGVEFDIHAEKFCNTLHKGLINREDESFCEKCIDIVGDLSRALGTKFCARAQTLMQDLYLLLKDSNAPPLLKPRAMTSIGDVALSIGGDFELYLPVFLDVLKQATLTRIEQGPMDNERWVDFIQKLRDGVLWAYAGIIHGLREDSKTHSLRFHIGCIIDFVSLIVDDNKSTDSNILKSIEVLGDLVSTYQDVAPLLMHVNLFDKLLAKANHNPDEDIKNQMRVLEQLMRTSLQ